MWYFTYMKKSPFNHSERLLFQRLLGLLPRKFFGLALMGLLMPFSVMSSEPGCETPATELRIAGKVRDEEWFQIHLPYATRYEALLNAKPYQESLANDLSPEAQLTLALTLISTKVQQPCSYDGDCTVIQPSATDFERALLVVDELIQTHPEDIGHGHWGILLCKKVHEDNDPAIHDCAISYAETLRDHHAEDAAGYLAVAELTLMVNDYAQAEQAMRDAQSARKHTTPFGLTVNRQAEVSSKHLPGPIDGEPEGIREMALVTTAIMRALAIDRRNFTIARYCSDTQALDAQRACLSAADALVLPGADLLEVKLSLAIQREILKRRTADARFDLRRAIYRARRQQEVRLNTTEMGQYAENDRVGYFQQLERLGECEMLKEFELVPPHCAKIQSEDRVEGL